MRDEVRLEISTYRESLSPAEHDRQDFGLLKSALHGALGSDGIEDTSEVSKQQYRGFPSVVVANGCVPLRPL